MLVQKIFCARSDVGLPTTHLLRIMGSDSDSDDDGDICLHSIDRDGDLLRTKNFGDKKKSRKKAKKKYKRANKAVVWTRNGQVKRWKGRDRLVIFLIGVAYGKDECNLGPLDDPGSDLAIFRDDHEEARRPRPRFAAVS